jgi:predicted amidophosphoribosyltransferase
MAMPADERAPIGAPVHTGLLLESVHNVVRAPLRTCRICATPIDGFALCWRCREHQRITGLADLVAPLIYAVDGSESAALLREYKNHPARSTRQRRSSQIGDLLRLAMSSHHDCFGAAVGIPVSQCVVIPSLTFRPGMHPMTAIAESLGLVGGGVLMPALDARCDRVVCADKFTVQPAGAVASRHVLVIDDVWTTGSNAQSAAVTLRRAGATAVSVLVIGRWLNSRNDVSARFVDELRAGYDPLVCPVTGGRCPAPFSERGGEKRTTPATVFHR